ncbi:replication initiation factor domain-containing protein [Lysobacter sp. A3-1-A15]|uniref:replication initiation factor domain-containing protein n=1 Tax=Novilysobacter viscosus TaxID=3098602 RepID=UPI002EDABCDC
MSQGLDGGGTLFILFGRHRGEFRAWFEFNPNKVVIAELEGRLCTMLENGMYSLVERGIVTYSEFAIDVPNAQIEDYVFLSRSHRQQDLGWINNGGIYIGSRRHGELHFHIYDKQRQLREAENTVVENSWLRVEARISGKRRFPLRSVLQLPSPFLNLLVLRRSCVEQVIADGLLGNIISAQGMPHEIQCQMSCLNGQQKKSVLHRLSEFEVDWWGPDLLWGRLEASLGWLHEGMSYSGRA